MPELVMKNLDFSEIALSTLQVLPAGYRANLQKYLAYAGWSAPEDMANLAAWKLYPSLLTVAATLLLPFSMVSPAVLAAAIFVLFFVPDLLIIQKSKMRQNEISSSLPQAIDIMLLGVNAGLSLDATLQRLASDRSSVSSALNVELARLGRDILLGIDREVAYTALFERTGVEELKSFGAALNQSSKMGLSVARVLQAQSEFIRLRQKQKAQEKAAKLPIWMAFPLWLCIMPSLLLILLGPSLLTFFQQLTK